jgi:hypothetical protein
MTQSKWKSDLDEALCSGWMKLCDENAPSADVLAQYVIVAEFLLHLVGVDKGLDCDWPEVYKCGHCTSAVRTMLSDFITREQEAS